MKKFYEILMNHAYAIVVLLCTSPFAPPWIQNKYGNEEAVVYCVLILVTSISILAFSFWWLTSDWLSIRPARMMMLCFASVLGFMISSSALLAIYGILPASIYLLWRDIPANILMGIVLIAAFIDLVFFGKKTAS